MHRTQVYLTEEQQQRIADRASDAGVSKAEILRRLLDEGLGVDDGVERRRRAIVETAGVIPEEPDWPEWLGRVRGLPAAQRLDDLDA